MGIKLLYLELEQVPLLSIGWTKVWTPTIWFHIQSAQIELGSLVPIMMDQDKCTFLVPARNHNQDNKPSARITFKITVQATEAMTGLRTTRLSSGAGWSAVTPMTMGSEGQERMLFVTWCHAVRMWG